MLSASIQRGPGLPVESTFAMISRPRSVSIRGIAGTFPAPLLRQTPYPTARARVRAADSGKAYEGMCPSWSERRLSGTPWLPMKQDRIGFLLLEAPEIGRAHV